MQQSVIKVGGKGFVCSCGANVFSTTEPFYGKETFKCNGCGLEYSSEVEVDPSYD